MADIRSFGFIRHLRADPSSYILYFRSSKLARSGRALSFWFRPLTAGLVEIPADDRELSILFHGRSADFQDIAVQGVLTYRVVDALRLSERVDFTIDPKSGVSLKQPTEKLSLLLSQLAQQHAWEYVSQKPVREILGEGHARIREQIDRGLRADISLSDMGLAIVSVRVSSVKPTSDLEKALAAPTREHIQQEADQAVFERRALAVEKERAIQENELQSQIELARREEQLIIQRGQNASRQASEEAEAQRIAAEAQAARTGVESAAEAASVQQVEGARAAVERTRMDIYRSLPPSVIFGLAAQQLAGKLERIEHLNLTPEIFGPMVRDLIDAGTKRLEIKPAAAELG